MKRTHHCNEIRDEHVGQTVTLNGWVHSNRDLGGVLFIDIRDREGRTQAVFDPSDLPADLFETASKLHSESVISVTGKVRVRPDGTKNEKIDTGLVEVVAEQLEVLNHADVLPFSIDDPEVAQLLGLTTLPRRLSHPGLCLFDAVTSTHEAAHQLLIVRGVHEQAEGVGEPLQDLPASSHVDFQEEVPWVVGIGGRRSVEATQELVPLQEPALVATRLEGGSVHEDVGVSNVVNPPFAAGPGPAQDQAVVAPN